MRFSRLVAAVFVLTPTIGFGATIYDTSTMEFETNTRQSIWGSGNAVRYEGKKLLTQNVNAGASVGTIVGTVSSGSAPTNPLWFIWKGCKETVNVFCGDEPDPKRKTVTIDTRTGAKASANLNGKIGAEVGYLLDGGSIGASFDYNAQALVPDRGEVGIGESFSLNPTSTWKDGEIDTQSPTAEAYASAYVDLDLTVSGEACAIGLGCTSGSKKIIDTGPSTQELVSIDPGGITFLDGFVPGVEIKAPLFNQTSTVEVGISPPLTPKVSVTITETEADGTPKTNPDGTPKKTKIGVSIPVGISVDVAEASIQFPEATGSAGLSGNKIDLDTQSDFVKVFADVDTLIPVIPPGGVNLEVGPLGVSLNAYDLKVGPTMDVFQDFEVTSDLFVDFLFDKDVEVAGVGLTRGWSGLWENLPDFKVFERTVFTPVFSVISALTNQTGLTFGFEAVAKLFEVGVGIGLGPISISGTLGPLFEKSIPFAEDFASISLFDKSFALEGFNAVRGASFVVDPTSPPTVPVPPAAFLFASGLALLRSGGRRREA